MPPTRIADVVVPEVFNPYVQEMIAELSAIQAAGIISSNPELDRLAASGGKMINMPFWEDLTGEDENLTDTGALTPDKIDADQDVAHMLLRGKAWAANDLAAALSGDDPMRRIGDRVAAFWARMRQKTLFATLRGVFLSPTMAVNSHDVHAGGANNAFTGTTFVDARYKLGDHENLLTAIAVHSATMASLEKQDLVEMKESEAGPIATYQGKRVIVDDGCPFEDVTVGGATVRAFTTYLFGEGAIGAGNGAPPVPTETDRDSLAGDDILINRQHFILHPRGVRFNAAEITGGLPAPSNTDLAVDANWTRVYDPKHIRIVKFVHRLE